MEFPGKCKSTHECVTNDMHPCAKNERLTCVAMEMVWWDVDVLHPISELRSRLAVSTSPGIKLTYFGGDFKGKAEPIRSYAAAVGLPVEYETVSFDEWPQKKPSTPFGSLPYATLPDGSLLAQSYAILMYIGESTQTAGMLHRNCQWLQGLPANALSIPYHSTLPYQGLVPPKP